MAPRTALWCVIAAGVLGSAPARAQSAGVTEPFVDAHHWTRDALRRLAMSGEVDVGAALDAWPLRRSEVRALLREAAGPEAHDARERGRRFARAALRAFEREYPAPLDAGVRADARLRSGWTETSGGLRGGTSRRGPGGAWVYPGPLPAPAVPGPHASVTAEAGWRGTGLSLAGGTPDALTEGYVAARAGPIDAWLGRRSIGFGAGTGGDLVLSPAHALDAFGLRTSRPLELPGPLDALGDVRGTLVLSQFARSGDVRAPWFAAASLRLSPAPGFTIGLHRATLFGGGDSTRAISARNIALMALGLTSQLGKDSGFENQVASIDVAWRFDPGWPLMAWAALAADDVGFSFLTTAATIVGLGTPAVPGVPGLALGVEVVRIPGSCCGHPPWYRHGDLGEGWTEEGRLLGHPLAGHGREVALDWEIAHGPVRLGGRLLTRARNQENLFSPDHGGSSRGGSLHAVLHTGSSMLLRLAIEGERGNGWQAWSGDLGLQLRVGPASRAPAATENAHADVRRNPAIT